MFASVFFGVLDQVHEHVCKISAKANVTPEHKMLTLIMETMN